MAGKKGRSGGARPGAGQKKQTTVEEQAARRDVVLSVFSPDEFRQCLEVIRENAKNGKVGEMYPLLPYLLGSPKQDINVSGEVNHKIVDGEAIRRAILGET